MGNCLGEQQASTPSESIADVGTRASVLSQRSADVPSGAVVQQLSVQRYGSPLVEYNAEEGVSPGLPPPTKPVGGSRSSSLFSNVLSPPAGIPTSISQHGSIRSKPQSSAGSVRTNVSFLTAESIVVLRVQERKNRRLNQWLDGYAPIPIPSSTSNVARGGDKASAYTTTNQRWHLGAKYENIPDLNASSFWREARARHDARQRSAEFAMLSGGGGGGGGGSSSASGTVRDTNRTGVGSLASGGTLEPRHSPRNSSLRGSPRGLAAVPLSHHSSVSSVGSSVSLRSAGEQKDEEEDDFPRLTNEILHENHFMVSRLEDEIYQSMFSKQASFGSTSTRASTARVAPTTTPQQPTTHPQRGEPTAIPVELFNYLNSKKDIVDEVVESDGDVFERLKRQEAGPASERE